MQSMWNKKSKMLVTPLMLIQIFSKRMLVDWPKCGSDPRDGGHLAAVWNQWTGILDWNTGMA